MRISGREDMDRKTTKVKAYKFYRTEGQKTNGKGISKVGKHE
jgi:hypothetical protein